MESVKNMTAVVLGGGAGIGRGIAIALAQRGCNIIVADLHEDAAKAVADEVAGLGVRSLALAVDVTNDAQIRLLRDRAFETFGTVNLLVNCPGLCLWRRLEDATIADWHKVMDVNLYGVIRSCGAFLPRMKAQTPAYSHIVNIGAMTALFAFPVLQNGIYSASKAAMLSYSDCLRLEEEDNGIRISVALPGSVDTELQANSAQYIANLDPTTTVNPPPPVSPGWPPQQVAEFIVQGIERGSFLIPTHKFLRERVADKYASYIAAFDALPD